MDVADGPDAVRVTAAIPALCRAPLLLLPAEGVRAATDAAAAAGAPPRKNGRGNSHAVLCEIDTKAPGRGTAREQGAKGEANTGEHGQRLERGRKQA